MRVACALMLVVAGCSRQAPAPPPSTIEIVKTPAGGKGSPYVMAFAEKQDGTSLFVRFLQGAQSDGALTISDLALYLTGHDADRLVTCRRDLVVAPVAAAAPAAVAYPRLVTKDVTDYVKECTSTPKTVTHTVTVYKQQYNAATKTNVRYPEQKEVTETINEKSCELVAKTQPATRYEDEIEASFIPPKLETLRPTYTKLELALGPPTCAPAVAGQPPHRIEGTIYRR